MFLKESCLTFKFGMMGELFVNSAYPLVWILRDFFNKKNWLGWLFLQIWQKESKKKVFRTGDYIEETKT